jgi:nitroreductase
MRRWEFIVVDDLETRKALTEPITPRSREQSEALVDEWGMDDAVQRAMYIDAIPKQARMILTAGALIIPCFYQSEPLLEPTTLSSLNGFASIWCCIENMFVAAAAEGIFGVVRIPFAEESANLKTVLSIPADYQVPCYVILGYPKPGAKRAKQHEVHARDRISINEWGRKRD